MLNLSDVEQALEQHPARTIERGVLHPSAVLLPLYVKEGRDHVLFTRRTAHLKHHSGEISFPGGRRHAEDHALSDTALRETEEEMGIATGDVCLLGRLDDFTSVHGYHVAPFVGSFPYPYPFHINPQEIAEVIEVPLETLCDPDIFHTENWSHKGRRHPVCFYTVGRHQIWGLTAAILRQFLQRIFHHESA